MMLRLTHASVYVLDQDRALDFYVNKLGFKKHSDIPMGPGARWLTVVSPDQPEVEIALLPTIPFGHWDQKSSAAMRELVEQGRFGFAAFKCKDVYAAYEEMKAKGVNFTMTPTKQPYGVIAVFTDDSGNTFSLSEMK
jgi:catechol 2,3-dioxygenase-like lactoylglutathione lyase family enzyme